MAIMDVPKSPERVPELVFPHVENRYYSTASLRGIHFEASKDKAKREEGWMTRQNPVVLPSGRILLPLYSDGFNASMMAISDDLGETWRPSLPIVGMGPIQPAVARKADGTLWSYMRDSGGEPKRALWSESKDDGVTWSPAIDTDIPNPGSSLAVRALADGRWVMAFNDADLGRHVWRRPTPTDGAPGHRRDHAFRRPT